MKRSKILLWILIPLILAGIGAGVFYHFASQPPKEPVYVYNWSMVGMSDYFEYGSDSYGMVTADKVQNIFLSGTQTVTEICVEEGDVVRKGDVLFTYDTSLSSLVLQRQELSIQQMKMDLERYKKELKTIQSYKPITVKPTTATTTAPAEQGKSPENVEGKNYLVYSGDGTTRDTPKLCWIRSNYPVSEGLIEELLAGRTRVYVVFQYSEGDAGNAEITDQFGVCYTRVETPVTPPEPTQPEEGSAEGEG